MPDLQPEPDVSVIVVSYHCREHVLACVDRVLGGVLDHRLEVLVVDNASSDGTETALRERHPEVRVLPMGRNAGFARANNRGIAESTGRYVLILNPDTLVETGAIDRMVDWADDHPWAGVISPALVYPDGRDQLTARSFPTPAAAVFGRRSPLTRWFPHNRWSSRFLAGRDHHGDEPFAIDWVSGACMLVPRVVIAHVGAFDEDFFLYWEDADWCRRMADAGYEVWCVPKARVVHDEGGTRDHGWPTPVVVHFHRGAYLYWRNHHAPQWWNPARWLAAGALAARGTAVVARDRLRASDRSFPDVPDVPDFPDPTPEQVML
jgi:GT2 family glycosyltransferase